MIRTLILEDDPAQADVLRHHLSRYGKETGRSFSVRLLRSARELCDANSCYDLVFLDIQLPDMSGMEAALRFRAHDADTPIIFVTELAQYAIEGYQVDALDFMVKPVAYPDFKIRIDRAIRIVERSADRPVFLPTKDGARIITLKDLVCIEVVNHKLLYHLSDGESFPLRGTLGSMEEELAGSTFERISHNCLVNLRHVESVCAGTVTMSDGEAFAISRSRRKEALAAIANYYGGNS